jgi:hypothetical protein
MSQIEPGPDSSSDAKMDALLKEFFANEVPAEFRQTADSPQPVSVHNEARSRGRRLTRWLGVSVVAGSLLTVAILLSQPSSQSPTPSEPARPIASSPELKPEADDIVAAEDANVDGQDTTDVEIFDSANGPVEQRIKNVLILDPDAGTGIEMLLPELEIEIFPIDDDDKNSPNQFDGDGAKFRFQLQPRTEGAKQHLYLRVQWPIAGQGVMRNLELDLGTDLGTNPDIERLLNSEPLKTELKRLPPDVRKQLESALRKTRFPASNIKQ